MPIYDYACNECGRVVEVVHGVNGLGPQACETCGGSMKKLLSSPAVHFKGSGWAKKDRGASSATKAAARSSTSGEGSGEGEAASKAEPGSEAKKRESGSETKKRESGSETKQSEASGATTAAGSSPD
jgi:putative FmdB family regulatory protein